MARCGNYELDRAIGWGRRSTYFAARVNGANGPALHVIRRARTVERSMGHAFMRAAAEQQAAVEAGCRRLAPIFAFDCDESGFAYYATNRYETSLADFLEGGCQVDSPQLRDIVTGVLGLATGLGISGFLAYKRSDWKGAMRERIAADGIRAEEIEWFRHELKSNERRSIYFAAII